jgi:hypothetical protein
MAAVLVSVKHPDLRSAELKLNRAREHVTLLEGELKAWHKRHPQPLTLDFKADPDPQVIPMIVKTIEDPDPLMSLIVGDALNNFRAALDHIAWQLVVHGGKPPSDPAAEEAVKFPILIGPSKKGLPADQYFSQVCASGALPGIDSVHETIVRQHQPYQRGDLAESHPLALLQRFNNVDKHRGIHLVLFSPIQMGFSVTPPFGCQVIGVKPAPHFEGPLRVGAEVGYITVADKTRCDHMKVEPRASVTIAFDERSPGHDVLRVFDVLDWIANEVTDVLGEIDRVL